MSDLPASRSPETVDIEIRLLLEGIFLKYGSDFRQYAFASVRRRVNLILSHFRVPTVSQLQDRIFADPAFFSQVLELLTVPTTEMFRDPAYFQRLREDVIPVLRTYPSFRVWIAGCSTGEELFSIAILLREEGLLSRAIIYATDINPRSLQKASEGIFPMDQIPLFTSNYQRAGGKKPFSDYYQAAYGFAKFDPSLTERTVFADHSLATDTVFAEVQLISCRNVLIYFDRSLQERVFGLFRDSLGTRGFLALGSKETLRFSRVADQFEEGQHKIFRKKGAAA
jgi:chemotaxis protein methyltransferase CheR